MPAVPESTSTYTPGEFFWLRYNGLTIGDGTAFPLYSITGLDAPDTRDQDQDRFDTDGAVGGRDLMAKRTVVVEIDVAENVNADFESRLASLRSAFVRRIAPTDTLPLTFRLPGQPEKRVNCRPRKRRIPVDRRFSLNNPTVVVELVGHDPRIYSEAESSIAWADGGLGQTVTNDGNIYSYPVIEIDAPATSPLLLTNSTLQREIKIEWTFTTGMMTIDLLKRTVMGNDGSSYYGAVSTTSKWWGLAPGANLIYVSTGGGTAQRRIKWRSAWDGI